MMMNPLKTIHFVFKSTAAIVALMVHSTLFGSGFVFSGSAPTPPSNNPNTPEQILLNTTVMGPIQMDVRATYDYFLEGEYYNTSTGLTNDYTVNTVDWAVTESALPAEGLSIASSGTFEATAYPKVEYPRTVSIDSATTEGAPDDEFGDPIEFTDSLSLIINQPPSLLSYTDWVSTETTLSGSEDAETDDPDADATTNLLEFGLDMDPETPDIIEAITTEYNSGTGDYTFTFTIPNDRRNITYSVETTTDLSADPIVWTDQILTLESETASTETWAATVNLGSHGFARLLIESYVP